MKSCEDIKKRKEELEKQLQESNGSEDPQHIHNIHGELFALKWVLNEE